MQQNTHIYVDHAHTNTHTHTNTNTHTHTFISSHFHVKYQSKRSIRRKKSNRCDAGRIGLWPSHSPKATASAWSKTKAVLQRSGSRTVLQQSHKELSLFQGRSALLIHFNPWKSLLSWELLGWLMVMMSWSSWKVSWRFSSEIHWSGSLVFAYLACLAYFIEMMHFAFERLTTSHIVQIPVIARRRTEQCQNCIL